MKSRKLITLMLIAISVAAIPAKAQINAEQVIRIGRNALYFDDYLLSIQYFNQAIQAKPYLAMPYFLRAIAKLNLDDYLGAEEDATAAIERNPFIADAFEVRGVARQNRGDSRGAIDDYDKALELLPENRGLLYNKAMAQQDVKDFDGARDTYAQLLKSYPGYENGYLGRAKLSIELGAPASAQADLDRAIEINKNMAGAYVLRAGIMLDKGADFKSAETDLDAAIRLLPHEAGLYINRAYARYKLDNFDGALADYEAAISNDPLNPVAYFNRGILRMETLDNDRALADFSQVLQLDPDDYRALYNRAMIYAAKKDYHSSIADISRVVDAFPDFPAARYTRFTIYEEMGDRANAMKDYDQSVAMFKSLRTQINQSRAESPIGDATAIIPSSQPREEERDTEDIATRSADDVARRFRSLLTIDNDVTLAEDHNNRNIRGRIQDRNQMIAMAPMFKLSFYADDDAEAHSALYALREAERANATRALRHQLYVVLNDVGPVGEEQIATHFQSVDYYNSYIATHPPRAIDFFGRGMDYMMLYNYPAAIADFTRALELNPDFMIALLMRADARFKNVKAERGAGELSAPAAGKSSDLNSYHAADALYRSRLYEVLADIDRVIALSPRMAIAYYNRGCVLAEMGDVDGSIQAFTRAIELEPNLGVAYYNRGYQYLQAGDSRNGTADLSHAGELGIVPSYNLLKRMNR
ncbi:MAG: tetratricopeptide repeat protein [Muribaculaceae bacterium]|nr:tetratricopeptide repeat protein [Muribaculaceae bacterium]